MRLRDFTLPTRGTDQDRSWISRAVQTLADRLREVRRKPLLNEAIISDIVVTTAEAQFIHGLGHVPTGWIVVDQDNGSNVWRTEWTDRTISLKASASTTVTIMVF